ncbi:MAG: hypothetical protein HZA31_12150 [Opitutae bacterium]|nr:hypothetical protein [Opitutae bacterium]
MSALTDNILIPLPGFLLPRDYPWRVRFIGAVDDQLRRLRSTGHFAPPRFYGYFFQGPQPVGVTGSWVVTLDSDTVVSALPAEIERITQGQYRIASESVDSVPDFILLHDTFDGSCWLWGFSFGLRFVESTEPSRERNDFQLDS